MVPRVKLFSAVAIMVCVVFAMVSFTGTSDADDTGTSFVGTVTENGSPLAGVTISVEGGTTVTTESDGRFGFTYTGTAKFTVSMRNYAFVSSDIPYSGSTFTVTSETSGTIIAYKTVEDYGGTVNANGTPIHDADVTYTDSDGNSFTTKTGSDGKYSITCPPSSYTVTVRCNGYETLTTDVTGTDINITISPVTVTIKGIIMDYSTNGTPEALVGVTVKVLAGSANPSATSGSNGFSISFPYTQSATITFSLNGYKVTVPGLSHVLIKQADGLTYKIDLTNAEMEDGDYVVSTDDSPIVMIKNMSKIKGHVIGYVKNTEYALKNATIRIDSGSGNVYETKTDEDGNFTIECPFGEYKLTAECNGFLLYGPVPVHTSDNVINIQMEAYGGSFIPGLDNAHSMMVLAIGVLALILILAGLCYYLSSKKGIGNIKADNDLGDDSDEE